MTYVVEMMWDGIKDCGIGHGMVSEWTAVDRQRDLGRKSAKVDHGAGNEWADSGTGAVHVAAASERWEQKSATGKVGKSRAGMKYRTISRSRTVRTCYRAEA